MAKTFGTKLEISRKFGFKTRGRIDTVYEDMLKHEGFVKAQKVKLAFFGVGVMEDSLLKVFKKTMKTLEKWRQRNNEQTAPTTNTRLSITMPKNL